MMWDYEGYGIVGMVGMVFFWGAVIWAITRAGTNHAHPGNQISATQILEARFAKGEIDANELAARRRGLSD